MPSRCSIPADVGPPRLPLLSKLFSMSLSIALRTDVEDDDVELGLFSDSAEAARSGSADCGRGDSSGGGGGGVVSSSALLRDSLEEQGSGRACCCNAVLSNCCERLQL